MLRTFEAIIDQDGAIRILEPISLAESTRVLVTILEPDVDSRGEETAILSETALADWNRPEEDEAWAYLPL